MSDLVDKTGQLTFLLFFVSTLAQHETLGSIVEKNNLSLWNYDGRAKWSEWRRK